MCHINWIVVFFNNCLDQSSRYHDLMLATRMALIYDTLVVSKKLTLSRNGTRIAFNAKIVLGLFAANTLFIQSVCKPNSVYMSAQCICVTYFRSRSVLDHEVQLRQFERPSQKATVIVSEISHVGQNRVIGPDHKSLATEIAPEIFSRPY